MKKIPRQRNLVLTGCDAAMAGVMRLTSPVMEAYARRQGYDFERVPPEAYRADSHPSWQKLRWLRERLEAGKWDAILWLDADTVITNPLVRMEDRIAGWGLTVSTDWSWPAEGDEIKHFSLGNFIMTRGPASMEVLDRAEAREEWANRPLWEQQAIQEEYREHEAFRRLVHVLPRRALNAVPLTQETPGVEPWERGDFLCHFTNMAHRQRMERIPAAVLEGFRARVPMIPEWHETGMCMDLRHIAVVRDVLALAGGKALEVGVWTGASSAAFFEALLAGEIESYTACDVGPQPQFYELEERFLRRAASRTWARPGLKLDMRLETSAETLASADEWDVVLLDGDHGLETGQAEAEAVLRRQPRVVLAHDWNSTAAGYPNCEGAAWIRQELRRDGWTLVLDSVDRPGEMTKRGLLAATKDEALVPLLCRAFEWNCW